MRQKILIVDDEVGITDLLYEHFSSEYDVLTANDGKEALCKIAEQPELILLDVTMPEMDGLTVCRRLREFVACPIIFLTARLTQADKIAGFQAGGDDYIVKPFDLVELSARVDAHLRREQRRQSGALVRFFGELTIDYSARRVMIKGQEVIFSRREFDILALLSLNAGQVFDRERIYEAVWGIDGDGSSDTVMEHIRKIRSKLVKYTTFHYITTVWGCGYKWNG